MPSPATATDRDQTPQTSPKPERAIPKGEEVLHTYGDLSDAQLLQTYGFVERLPGANPHNYALVSYQALVQGAALTLGKSEAKAVVRGKLLEAKEALMTAAGLLQAAAPRDTEFVATADEPLSDELLTTVQVGDWGCAQGANAFGGRFQGPCGGARGVEPCLFCC
jgi:hypothetical protein